MSTFTIRELTIADYDAVVALWRTTARHRAERSRRAAEHRCVFSRTTRA